MNAALPLSEAGQGFADYEAVSIRIDAEIPGIDRETAGIDQEKSKMGEKQSRNERINQ
ncbi:hypothetical protein [Salibacterium lacus]|uniref:Uncharacterized protein n=1 Tax=Salibacterium lacus TaxID=1898109 RepID=A0ABW5T2P9_9BACI